MSEYPATREQIVHRFLSIPVSELHSCNWMEAWNVNDETYINGVLLFVDFDYIMGYLIECVDRTEATLSYHAIVTFHGPAPDGSWLHESVIYEPECGTFFARTEAADRYTVSTWGLGLHG